ncbi:hypothetical protein WP12_19170 [Sphingomonas sp. SRS2]|nr:hypothetical protein WP12_19170 [Sphingomonas sp. SRS2]
MRSPLPRAHSKERLRLGTALLTPPPQSVMPAQAGISGGRFRRAARSFIAREAGLHWHENWGWGEMRLSNSYVRRGEILPSVGALGQLDANGSMAWRISAMSSGHQREN